MWNSYPWVAYIDIFWLFAGLTALFLSFFVLKVKEVSDKSNLEKVEEKMVYKHPAKDLILKAKSIFF